MLMVFFCFLLLPGVCRDVLRVCAGQLRPEAGGRTLFDSMLRCSAFSFNQRCLAAVDALQVGALPYLASWAAHLADIGLRLPEQQLEALCSYVGRHGRQLSKGHRQQLQRAFDSWGYQPGVALMARLDGAQ